MRGKPLAWGLLALFALASTASMIVAGYRYLPVQVDGGWASYAAFAISEGRDPYVHQGSLEEQEGVEGLKSLFFFDTASNVRALYASGWFRIVDPSWRTIKILTVLEFLVLLAAAGIFFRVVLPSPQLAVLATALLATDKTIASMAAADFRPDMIQAALGCLFYLALRRARPTLLHTLGLAVFGALFGTVSATAVTPIAVAAAVYGAELLFGLYDGRRRRVGQLALAVGAAAGTYLFRKSLFGALLGAERTPLEPVATLGRIAQVWSGGLPALAAKEAVRLDIYFLMSNVPLLVALGLGVIVWLLPTTSPARARAGVWAGVLATGAILFVLDPHPTHQHVVPAMPFVLLLLGRVDDLTPELRRPAVGFLVALVAGASVIGFAVAGRTVVQARAAGFDNPSLERTLRSLVPEEGGIVVAGGTEFWSYWDPDSDVTIVDVGRRPSNLGLLEPILTRVDHAVLSADYAQGPWLSQLRDEHGIEPFILVDQRPYVVVTGPFEEGSSEPEALP